MLEPQNSLPSIRKILISASTQNDPSNITISSQGPVNYTALSCLTTFKDVRDLNYHLKSMYQKTIPESQFFCQIKTCKELDRRGASFTSKDKLSRHIYENHLGVDSQ